MPPLCQIFSPVSLFKVTNVPWAPPGVTTTMSPTMSGDSEYPQPGKPPLLRDCALVDETARRLWWAHPDPRVRRLRRSDA